MTNLLHSNDDIFYGSRRMFENPTVNLSALCNTCTKISHCSWDFFNTDGKL